MRLIIRDDKKESAMFGHWFRHKQPTTLSLQFSIVVEEDEGKYHAFAPAFRGLHVDGESKDEAFHNAVNAVFVYLESLSNHGEPLPVGPDLRVHTPQPQIPEGAFLRNVTVQWPSLQMSGIS